MGILAKTKNYFTNMYYSMGAYATAGLLASQPAFAAAGSGGAAGGSDIDLSSFDTFLQQIVTALTGPLGKTVAVLALIGVGFMFFTGRINWMHVVAILAGIGVIFLAPTILAGLG